MENTFIKKFEREMDDESITILNEILNNKYYTEEQRDIIFNSALCIIHTGDQSISYLKQLHELLKNEKIINNKSLLQVLSSFITECNKKNLFTNIDYEQRNLLQDKIKTIITVIMESPNLETDLNDPDFINILNGIISEKLKYNNYQFICELCQNKNVKNNLQKRNIALEVALNKEVDIMTTNSNLYPHAVNVLGDKDILSLDSATYRKVVSTAIVNIQAYPLYIALKQENLTPKKKKAIIDYYYEILDKYLQKYLFVDINEIKKKSQTPIFSVVYCNRLLSMSDDNYVKTLKQIRLCNKPLSYAVVLSSDSINEEQLEIALELISKGPAEKISEYNRYPEADYKYQVARIAISPVLTKLPKEAYKKFITLINSYCEQCNILNENKEFDKWQIIYSKIDQIVSLFYNQTLYEKNIERLLIAVDEIISADDNRYLIEQIGKFCNHNNSAYYNNYEYKMVIYLLKHQYLISKKEKNFDKFYNLVDYFTNKNIPFIENKRSLFDTFTMYTAEEIKKQTEIMNNQGQYNINIYRIFNGIDQTIIGTVTDNKNIYIRKLVPPYTEE